jgi:hypothetical protein
LVWNCQHYSGRVTLLKYFLISDHDGGFHTCDEDVHQLFISTGWGFVFLAVEFCGIGLVGSSGKKTCKHERLY